MLYVLVPVLVFNSEAAKMGKNKERFFSGLAF
jgi:hypothetical protein